MSIASEIHLRQSQFLLNVKIFDLAIGFKNIYTHAKHSDSGKFKRTHLDRTQLKADELPQTTRAKVFSAEFSSQIKTFSSAGGTLRKNNLNRKAVGARSEHRRVARQTRALAEGSEIILIQIN